MSCVYDPILYSFDETSNFFNHPHLIQYRDILVVKFRGWETLIGFTIVKPGIHTVFDQASILEKESDEFIKSSVEDLIPIPRESEDSSGSDSESILPLSDDFSPIFEEKSMTFSNLLFDSNDFTSSDNESLSDIECRDSYDSNLDESTLLVTPLSDSNEDEFFTPSDDVELLLHHDPSISVVSILEGFTDKTVLSREWMNLLDLESKEMTGRRFCTMLQLMI
ncbi:hypothetical protein Tco_0311461 [Tanacetum coccineum]